MSYNKIFLGFDTSCYTTSIAAINLKREIIFNERKMLDVKKGQRGLRQSEAVYQHSNNISDILYDLKTMLSNYHIEGICVSVKPRPVIDSYMPVFNFGYKYAKSMSAILNVPLFETTHQEGHIECAYFDTNINKSKFICVHISGGTTEILLVNKNKDYFIDIIGATKDISCGQLIDRIGVKLGYEFPCGMYIDENALNCDEDIDTKISVSNGYINFSGAENTLYKELDLKDKNYISKKTLLIIEKSLFKSLKYLCEKYKVNDVLFVGGVSSSKFLSHSLKKDLENINIASYWSDSQYAKDNALGTALIGLNHYLDRNDKIYFIKGI